MTFAERLERWNFWYDGVPEDWRFQMLIWPLILIGTINMILSIAMGFPFGFLVLLAIIAAAVVRVPYLVGWVKPAAASDAVQTARREPKISIAAPPWLWKVNVWYDGLPETRRPWVILAVLVFAGGLNMLLTIHNGFSFGILFLLALLALILIRAPYTAGWLLQPPPPERLAAPAMPGQISPRQISKDNAVHAAPMSVAAFEPVLAEGPAAPERIVHPQPPKQSDDLPSHDRPA